MKVLKGGTKEAAQYIKQLSSRLSLDSPQEGIVKEIISNVKERGDIAIKEYFKKFDNMDVEPENFILDEDEWEKGAGKCSKKIKEIIDRAALRLEAFYSHTVYNSWYYYDEFGNLLGNRFLPLERVLVYAPGGKATYPSSVLMGAIPARIAGVSEIILTTPARKEGVSPAVLYAARRAGVNKVYKIGGAQAIAGFSFGTKTLPRVDKVVGPGNIFVATAKKLLYGVVDIDMVAGPSEVLVIFDETASLKYVAFDMLSQLEHDEEALAVALSTDEKMALSLKDILEREVKKAKRKAIINKSLRNSAIIVVKDLTEATEIANIIAPEHLEIMTKEPQALLPMIKNAGAVFLGRQTPEAVGDYMAGPNHVLPTGGTARFFSPLGVESFVRRMSVIGFSEAGLRSLGEDVAVFADEEGLFSHADSVRERLKSGGKKVENKRRG